MLIPWINDMDAINKEPIFADFNNCDEDGAIRLVTSGSLADLQRMNILPSEGELIWLTDHDVEVIGKTAFRNGTWVVTLTSKFKQVAPEAPYHISNIDRSGTV
jgi:hypothetical protein